MSTFTWCSLNNHISFNLGRGQSRDHLSLVNCDKTIMLHKNKQLQANILGKRLNLEKMFKTSHISETHALIQVSSLIKDLTRTNSSDIQALYYNAF